MGFEVITPSSIVARSGSMNNSKVLFNIIDI